MWAMPFGLNPWELGLIFLVILLLFGAKRLPELGRSMGRGIREFKTSVEGKDKDKEGAEDESEAKETAAKS
jgi:sec-independent protein translocase protein TatA